MLQLNHVSITLKKDGRDIVKDFNLKICIRDRNTRRILVAEVEKDAG